MLWTLFVSINWSLWIPIGISVIVAGTGLYLAIDNRNLRKAQADNEESSATATLTKSALSLVAPMQKQITALEKVSQDQGTRLTMYAQRITDLEHGIDMRDLELEGLRAGLVVLTNQLRRLEIVPEYTPPTKVKTGPLGKKD